MTENTEAELQQVQQFGEYLRVRKFADGSIAAVGKLLFTWAIYQGCNQFGYERRFCFETQEKADEEFNKLQNADEMPEGFIAMRPKIGAHHEP